MAKILQDNKGAMLFPLADPVFRNEIDAMELEIVSSSFNKYRLKGTKTNCSIYAIRSEYREPKAGEWYLSGAVAEAYKAPNDLSTKYWVAKLVAVSEMTVLVRMKEL